MTSTKVLDTSLMSVNQISFINDDTVSYEIAYYGNYVNTYPLYIVFNGIDVYFSCVDGKKYLVFALTNKNKEMLENTEKFGMKSKYKLEQ